MTNKPFRFFITAMVMLLCGCKNGPEYKIPQLEIPEKYKEISSQWKVANPQEDIDRGEWWKIFKDERLNQLVQQVNIANQDIAVAYAQYKQALSLIDQSRSGYAPTLGASGSLAKQRVFSASATKTQTAAVSTSSLNASWEPDFWGRVGHAVAANEANAEASAAQLALTRLSMQASLVQYYFQLCKQDKLGKILDSNVESYKKLLKITQQRKNAGVASELEIVTVKSQLEAAQVKAIDNGVLRAQYEHAIAVLIGKAPCDFSIAPQDIELCPPPLPSALPSELLERRPDIAQAERHMAAANEQIGVARAAFFPTFTFNAAKGISNSSFGQMLQAPLTIWSIGPQLAFNIFDGGLIRAKEKGAVAAYDQSVATYRKTVLAAFQDVEDNLVSLRLLEDEVKIQTEAVANAELQLRLVTDQYISGTAALSDVITAQINLYNTKNTLNTILSQRILSSVGLIKALGGGWNRSALTSCHDKPML